MAPHSESQTQLSNKHFTAVSFSRPLKKCKIPKKSRHVMEFNASGEAWTNADFSQMQARGGCNMMHLSRIYMISVVVCLVAQPCLTLLQPHGLQPARLLCPWYFPGKNTEVGFHFLLHYDFRIIPCLKKYHQQGRK